jgi:hypothetical protein
MSLKAFHPGMRLLALPLFLFAGACMNDSGDGGKPPAGKKDSFGGFLVSLVQPTEISQGYTSVVGQMYSGATPSSLVWETVAKSGSCTLFKPKVPFCETPCGSGAACVADNKCMDFPKPVSVGKVTVTGVKTKDGASTFTMDPLSLNFSYLPAGSIQLKMPPFAEGDAVEFSAAGDTGASAFKVSAKGIAALAILNDTIVLADNQPILLKWTAPADPANSTVSAVVDISHHGGTKGKIECEGPDNGALEIAAPLVTQLKALGVSGFPKIDVARRAVGNAADVHVSLALESAVTKSLQIPGLISCGGPEDCPDGKTCQPDLQCK